MISMVFIVDFDPLTLGKTPLNFVQQVLLNRFFAGYRKNVMRNKWPIDQLFDPLSQRPPYVHENAFPGWHKVLALSIPDSLRTRIVRLPRFFSRQDFDRSVNLGKHRWVFWLASFENFRNSRQTTGNVRYTRRFTGNFSNRRTSCYFFCLPRP